jgi:hypothetical protein
VWPSLFHSVKVTRIGRLPNLWQDNVDAYLKTNLICSSLKSQKNGIHRKTLMILNKM